MGGAKQNRRRCGRVTCCASEKWEGQGSPRRQEHNRLAQRRPQRARRVLPWLETLAGVFEAVCTGDVETPGKMEGHQRASSGLDTTMRQRGRYLRHCQLQALHACSQPGSCTRVCRTDVFFSTDGRAGRTCTVLAVPRPAKRSQLRWWQGAGAPPANLVRAQSIFDRCLSHTISPFTSSAACARSSVTVSYPKGGLSHRDPQRDGLMATRERRRRASRARPLRLSHSSSSSVSRPCLALVGALGVQWGDILGVVLLQIQQHMIQSRHQMADNSFSDSRFIGGCIAHQLGGQIGHTAECARGPAGATTPPRCAS